MSPNDPMPFGKHKGTPIKDVPKEYKDWLVKQDGFATKNPELHACFTGKAPTADESETDAVEDLLMSDAPDGFPDWWWKQYGKNLRREKSMLYIGYLRVALEAWRASSEENYRIQTAMALSKTPPPRVTNTLQPQPLPAGPSLSDDPFPQF